MIEVTREAGIVHMTIRRPEKKNALTPAMYHTLRQQWMRLARTPVSMHW